ncbi:Uncharacterized protein Adt_21241 [Abeliophyllum distichum]|uniref:Reverse transcriptase domain-containing protein n=1 Tax=Abeliophyllum distichum TaxID=126358 RepID=A0ABD1SYS5_9LAMI
MKNDEYHGGLTSIDTLHVLEWPITRSRAKKIKEAMQGLVYATWAKNQSASATIKIPTFQMSVKEDESISIFLQASGEVFDSSDTIQPSVVSFFQELLSALQPVDPIRPGIIPRLVSDEDNLQLNQTPTLTEVREAIFSIDPDSVTGPDGFSSHFFQVCCDIVSEDVFQVVLDFFVGGHLPKGFAATSIVLLPKRDNACRWSEFRPISLCTLFNKLITKLMNSRLSTLLPQIISAPQSGFISGRLIGDNVLLAQELLHTLDTKVGGGNVILKLDMAKAYDRMDWSFLIFIMEGFGFDALWIDRIRRCISECRFSILINGRPCGFFSSSRRLRQGDPISPSLFIIAADYFSRLLTQQY